ncbi:MAG: MmcQ/YjbR family DNA-binding protein [Bacteroidota bacterium]
MNIEQIREICLSFPNVTEDIKWEKDLCFCIGDKMFAVTGLADGHSSATFKVSAEEYELLIERDGITPAPYLARHKWVLAEFSALTKNEWNAFLVQSYQLVKAKLPARIRKKLS